jgi:hypothetical protein
VSASRQRVRSGWVLKLVAAVYLVALAALPFGHHDIACHLKSSTHCTVCLVGTSADDPSAQPAIPQIRLADVGRMEALTVNAKALCAPASSSGRSPPIVSPVS